MQLQPAAFNRLLGDMGQACHWRRAFLCPCRKPYSGAADHLCLNCNGLGTFWTKPVEAHTGLTGLKTAREWASFGMWESGDVVWSVPSDSALYGAGENDQVVMTNSEETWNATLTRGAPDERLPAYLVKIEDVFVLTGTGAEATAKPGLASMQAGGVPIWPAGQGPQEGQQYSIRARRRPCFFIFKNLPQDRAHHGGKDLPRRVVGRRFELFGAGQKE